MIQNSWRDLPWLKQALEKKLNALQYFRKKINEISDYYQDSKKNKGTSQNIEHEMLTELSFNFEAFLFEFESALDIFLKLLLRKNHDERLYFTIATIEKITPRDDYIESIIKYWEEGIDQEKVYSLERANHYRNLAGHGGFLRIPIIISRGEEKPIYCLNDNGKLINMVEFCEKMEKMLNYMRGITYPKVKYIMQKLRKQNND